MSPGLSHRSLSHSISPQQEFSRAQIQTQLSHPTRALQRAGRPEPVHHPPVQIHAAICTASSLS